MPHSSERGLGTLARVYQFILGLSRKRNASNGGENMMKHSANAAKESDAGEVE
jgi:hypothetical protein